MRLRIPLVASFALVVAVSCDQQPAEPPGASGSATTPQFAPHGNANKEVLEFYFTWDTDCGGGKILTVDFSGTGQFTYHNGRRNVELNVWHNTWLYTNSAGETYRWIDTGPDRYYYNDDGDLIISVTGTSTASGPGRDEVNVGTMVFNTDTDQVEFIAGRDLGYLDNLACEAL